MQKKYIVSTESAFMYLYPDKKSEVTDELLYGTIVTYEDESYAGYVFCKTDYGYLGYVDISSLSPKLSDGEKYVVTSTFCDLYEYPEYRFSPKLTLPRGSIIEGIIGSSQDERFLCIQTQGRRFFMPKACIKKMCELSRFESVQRKRCQIVKNAFSYLGVPYRWGGKSTFGIDCSGLCFMAYRLSGLPLYRDAEFDGKYVKEIPFEKLKPCDLIYYNGHVTMYIGDNEYIHSSATLGGVKISSFDENSQNFYPRLKSDIVKCARSLYLNQEYSV